MYQVAMASVLGALIGFFTTLWFGQKDILWLAIGTITGAVSGFILYQPAPVLNVFRAVVRAKLREHFSRFFALKQEKAFHLSFAWLPKFGLKLLKFGVIISYVSGLVLLAYEVFAICLLLAGGINLDLGWSSVIFVSYSVIGGCIFLFGEEEECKDTRKRLWLLPLSKVAGRLLTKIQKPDAKFFGDLKTKNGKYFQLAALSRLIKFSAILFTVPFYLVFCSVLFYVDCPLTVFLALASTRRLAAMAGAATGCIAGWACHNLAGCQLAFSLSVICLTALIVSIGSLRLRALAEKIIPRFQTA